MPNLDTCIAGTFVVGNIGADAGEAVLPVLGSLLDPDDYDPETDVSEYSLDFTRFYNSMYLLLLMV